MAIDVSGRVRYPRAIVTHGKSPHHDVAHWSLFDSDVTLITPGDSNYCHYYRACLLKYRESYLAQPENEEMYDNDLLLQELPVNDWRGYSLHGPQQDWPKPAIALGNVAQ